jgi:hypothetical protein
MRASRLRKKSKIRFVASPICLGDHRTRLPLLARALAEVPAEVLDAGSVEAR